MEAAIWLYPWDLLDGGVERVLDDIAARGITAVHLAVSYHSVLALLPHNPRRRTYLADRAALYFERRSDLWQDCELEPTVSSLVAEQGDALAAAGPACQARGLRLVAWTVCLHNTDLALRHPAVNVVNVRGEAYRNMLCPAQPQVRAYLRAMVGDLRDRAAGIELEAPHWMPFPHHQHAKMGVPLGAAARLLLNLCFCEHCQARAGAANVDMAGAQARLGGLLDRMLAEPPGGTEAEQLAGLMAVEPELAGLVGAREETVASLMDELVREASPTLVSAMPLGPAWLTGVDRARLARMTARFEILAYGSPSAVAAATSEALDQVPDADRLMVGLSLLDPETPDRETCLASVQAAREAGAQHLSFYNYGLASAERLDWMRDVLKSA